MCTSQEVVRQFPLLSRLQTHFRRARVKKFVGLLSVNESTTILDVGGEPYYWKDFPLKCKIVCLNIHESKSDIENVTCAVYDGGRIPYDAQSFDVVHCNSVIEHVGNSMAQARFAQEIRRVGKKYWVQVPNYYFPWEPHAFFPFYQFLSDDMKALIRKYWNKTPYVVDELLIVRLLSASELRFLFPEAALYRERFMGLTKSLCAYR